ncbi:MAG TPA: sugar phosphate isomerase/epimerase, partial [Verrucomicrobiae bacterium]|nr:sugar phosphate isomerase/epimerase [Verrucomicrobiae bacterium]
WNFAVVGRGKDQAWWNAFVRELVARSLRVQTLAIEHEDPFVAPEDGIREAAATLSTALESRVGC